MSAKNIGRLLHDGQLGFVHSTDAGTITPLGQSPCLVELVSAGAETRTLARPTKKNAEITLQGKTIAGTITITVTGGYNRDGDTTFAITAVGQWVSFRSGVTSAGVYFWEKTGDYELGNIAPADSTVLKSLSTLTATAAEINARAAAASRIVNITDAATYTVLAANSGKIHIFPDLSQNCTVAMCALGVGLEYTFIGKGIAADASNWIFQGAEAGTSFLGGAVHLDSDAGAASDEVVAVYPNGSSNDFHTIITPGAGTRVYMICDGTNWIVNTIAVSATAPTFSDT